MLLTRQANKNNYMNDQAKKIINEVYKPELTNANIQTNIVKNLNLTNSSDYTECIATLNNYITEQLIGNNVVFETADDQNDLINKLSQNE
tara:strand:+ start:196 stop:465 length:270 start_codon:yes stop_codon:yes gene_type:complete